MVENWPRLHLALETDQVPSDHLETPGSWATAFADTKAMGLF